MSEYDKAMTAALKYQSQLHELYHVLRPAIEAAMKRNGLEFNSIQDVFNELARQDKALLRAGEILGITESENGNA